MDDWSPKALAADPMRVYRAKRDSEHKTVASLYQILGFISSGTYGRVYKAKCNEDGMLYAIKKFKPDKEGDATTYTGISQSAIREIALNREILHENVVALKEVILEDKSIYMVFEYAEHDFLQLIHHHSQTLRTSITMPVLKSLTFQLLNGLEYLHAQHILHRDLKPANVLVSAQGVVKIGDLGLARLSREPLHHLFLGDKVVVTIWYRAPELLLGTRHYGRAVDTWAVGCVLAELASLRPVFKGEEAKMDAKKNVPFQRDQMIKIFEVLGTIDDQQWPGVQDMPEYASMKRLDGFPPRLFEWCQSRLRSHDAYDLLQKLFTYDPDRRLTAAHALQHPWFKQEPLPTQNAFVTIPTNQMPPQRRLTQDDAPTSALTGILPLHATHGPGAQQLLAALQSQPPSTRSGGAQSFSYHQSMTGGRKKPRLG